MYYIIGRYNPNIELLLDILKYPVIMVTFEEIPVAETSVLDIYKDPYRQCLEIGRRKYGSGIAPVEIITTFDNVVLGYDGVTRGTHVSEELSFLEHDHVIPTVPVEKCFTHLYHPESLFDEKLQEVIRKVNHLMIIPSVLSVRQRTNDPQSVFTKEERLEQTMKQGDSIRNVRGERPTTVLVEMSRSEDLTSYDVHRLRQKFDVVILGYRDNVLMEYVHYKSHKSISEAYVFLAMLKVVRSSGAGSMIKFGGRYHFKDLPYYGILTDSGVPMIRYHEEIQQAFSELYSIPKEYYDIYERHLKGLITGLLENEATVMDIEKMLYHFAKEVGCEATPRLFACGYNSKGAFNLI